MEAIEYFKELASWTNRHFKNGMSNKAQRIRVSEARTLIGESTFSQIELNRLTNK